MEDQLPVELKAMQMERKEAQATEEKTKGEQQEAL